MRAFLKSIDKRVQQKVINDQKPPIVLTSEVTIQNDIYVWDRVDYENCGWNSKAINAIFNGVTTEEFRRISHCELAKEAWDILQVTHEGTTTVKIIKPTFEIQRIEDGETFDQFYLKFVASST